MSEAWSWTCLFKFSSMINVTCIGSETTFQGADVNNSYLCWGSFKGYYDISKNEGYAQWIDEDAERRVNELVF